MTIYLSRLALSEAPVFFGIRNRFRYSETCVRACAGAATISKDSLNGTLLQCLHDYYYRNSTESDPSEICQNMSSGSIDAAPPTAAQLLCPDCHSLYTNSFQTSQTSAQNGGTNVNKGSDSADTDSFTPRVRSDKRSIIILLGEFVQYAHF